MATIRATCPGCGDVRVTSRDVCVRVCHETKQGSYAFRCPVCRLAVSKRVEPHVVNLLVRSGVKMSVWHLPAELEEPKRGAPICHDDILEFHFALMEPDVLHRLRSSAPREAR